jgi:hypothetical protein
LGSKELSFHLLGNELLGGFFLLELLKLLGSLLSEDFLLLSLLLSRRNFLLKLFVLLDLKLSLLFLRGKLLEKSLLLGLLLLLEIQEGLVLDKSASLSESFSSCKSNSLLVSFFSGFLKSFFHCSKLLGLVGTFWLFDGLN